MITKVTPDFIALTGLAMLAPAHKLSPSVKAKHPEMVLEGNIELVLKEAIENITIVLDLCKHYELCSFDALLNLAKETHNANSSLNNTYRLPSTGDIEESSDDIEDGEGYGEY